MKNNVSRKKISMLKFGTQSKHLGSFDNLLSNFKRGVSFQLAFFASQAGSLGHLFIERSLRGRWPLFMVLLAVIGCSKTSSPSVPQSIGDNAGMNAADGDKISLLLNWYPDLFCSLKIKKN